MKRKAILTVVILALASLAAFAQTDAAKKFQEANDLYREGEYKKAVAHYQEILQSGYESADLYYNIGNAYFKLEKIPDAILFYERAKRLEPDDEDVDFNLKLANLRIIDKIKPVPKLFLVEWYETLYNKLSSDSWARVLTIFSFLAFLSLAGYLLVFSPRAKKGLFFSFLTFLIVAIASLIFAVERYNYETARDEAIIFSPSVYVKSSPDEDGSDLFILHEGTKAKILDEVGKWRKIKLADGNVGWLPAKAIEVI